MMDDSDILNHIEKLLNEEHEFQKRSTQEGPDDDFSKQVGFLTRLLFQKTSLLLSLLN
jgi:hypothetical protein